jgi:hypothetical protein
MREKFKWMNLSSLGPLGWISTLCWLQLEVLKPRRGVFGTTSITKMWLNWWKGVLWCQQSSGPPRIICSNINHIHSCGEIALQCAYKTKALHNSQYGCCSHIVSDLYLQHGELEKASERSVVLTYIATECKPPSQHNGSIPVSFALQYQHKLHTFAWRPVQAPCSCITSSSSTT